MATLAQIRMPLRTSLRCSGVREAGIKSFRRRDEERQPPDDDSGNPSVDFRGETLRNETHRSITDPEARLMRKGKGREAKLGTLSWRTATGC